jgi:hypothetical protein
MALTRFDLVITPCSDSKRGSRRSCREVQLTRLLDKKTAARLRRGRKLALRARVDLDSERITFLYLYSGFLYSMRRFRRYIRSLLREGVHILILSGGYGLVHPLERGHSYNVKIRSTASVWKPRLPKILKDYIKRNRIRRVFVAGSLDYAKVLAAGLRVWEKDVRVYWFVPRYDGRGNPYRSVAHRIGRAVFGLSRTDEPDHRWKRKPPTA